MLYIYKINKVLLAYIYKIALYFFSYALIAKKLLLIFKQVLKYFNKKAILKNLTIVKLLKTIKACFFALYFYKLI